MDIYYSSENFIRSLLFEEGTRLADIEDIIAMKVDVILRGGRKKDFWDLHELMDRYSLSQMILLHEERHPFTHDKNKIIANFINFDHADKDFNPICLRGKHWEFITDDFRDWVND